MIERVNDTQNMRIQAYGLEEFLRDVQELFQRGYVLDFETNEHYPQSIGHLFTAVLVPAAKVKEGTAEARTDKPMPEVTPELQALQAVVEEGKKAGRKPKTA